MACLTAGPAIRHHNGPVEQKRPSWLRRWYRSETFWQGIAVQTIGTLIAASIIALVAIFVGIGYTPAVRYYVILGLLALVYIMVLIVVGVIAGLELEEYLLTRQIVRRHPSLDKLLTRLFNVSPIIVAIIVLATTGPFVLAIRDDVARWTGYSP